MHITKWKKLVLKGYRMYDSTYMMFWKRQNHGDNEITGCQGLGSGGEMTRWGREGFRQWKCTVWHSNDRYLSPLGCFSPDCTGIVCFGEEAHRGKVTSSSPVSRVHTMDMIYQCWCWPWSPGRASAVRFVLHKATLCCPLFLIYSWKKSPCTHPT